MISICTQVYNTRPFLKRCIESVLNQTFSDIEYILIDNGSTDGSGEILDSFAKQDERIKLFRLEKNRMDNPWRQAIPDHSSGEYVALLDSDDWLGPTFLERMVSLAERNQLDIVCTGTTFHMEGQENIPSGARSFPQRLIIEKPQFAAYLPYYHAFFRTAWGKLIHRDVFMAADHSIIDREGISNGADTLAAFAWLRQAKRICVDNSVLHHYLVRKKSVSRVYLPNRFKSNTVLHQDAVDFLSQYGPVSRENLHFLHIVYANAVWDTLDVLWNSSLSPEEKMTQYCAIAVHPTTRESYQDTDAAIERSRNTLLQQLLAVAEQAGKLPECGSEALRALRPRCGGAVTSKNLPLFQTEAGVRDALLRDDADGLARQILDLIEAKRFTKQYDLGALMCALAGGHLLLSHVDDVQFMRKYRAVYWSIWQGNTLDALDEMTGMFLENRVKGAEETFLQLYLSAAALLEQVPAFVFGKTRLARLYLRQRQWDACRAVLDELAEMGVEDDGELTELRREMEAAT